jgi:hypothetical protein
VSTAKKDGSSTIQEARQQDLKVQQSKLELEHDESTLNRAKSAKAHADQATADSKKQLASEAALAQKSQEQINQLQMQDQQDKMALASTLSKRQALGAAFKREGNAEEALQVEMAALKRATKREQAMERAFESAQSTSKQMKSQVAVDQSFVKRGFAADSKLHASEVNEKAKVKDVTGQADRAEEQLTGIKRRVKEMREQESGLIRNGQTALAAEVSAKAKMAKVEDAVRSARSKAKGAAHAAQIASQEAPHLERNLKKSKADVLSAEAHLSWTKKVSNAENKLAEQELAVAQQDTHVVQNTSLTADSAVALDEALKRKTIKDAAVADKLESEASKLMQNTTNDLVNVATQSHDAQISTQATQAQQAAVKFDNAASAALQSQHKFDSADSESVMTIQAASDAAARYGHADTEERVSLEKLKTLLPKDEADAVNEAAAHTREALSESTLESKGSSGQEALWAEQNARELKLAHTGGAAPSVTLGETQTAVSEMHKSQISGLGKLLHKARLSMDMNAEEDAIDEAQSINVRSPNDEVMLKLAQTLHQIDDNDKSV